MNLAHESESGSIAAPINKLGVKIPPEPPLPIEMVVAIIFSAIIDKTKSNKFPTPDEISLLEGKLSPRIKSLFSSLSNEIKSEVTSNPFLKHVEMSMLLIRHINHLMQF